MTVYVLFGMYDYSEAVGMTLSKEEAQRQLAEYKEFDTRHHFWIEKHQLTNEWLEFESC